MPFSSPQRSLIFKALQEAEERTTGYYCIPPFRWERLHYDLLTQRDHGWESIPESMLARVRCLQRIKNSLPLDFYRIELNDSSILAAAKRERLTPNLYPFFVYILTHEMIHLIRLSSILDAAPEEASHSNPESEEQRVQNISRRILTESTFQPVLDRFCSGEL